MRTSDFDYELPVERIAQVPVEPRHSSRLLVYSRKTKEIEHSVFWHLERFLNPGDLLVVNQTRVIPARIHAIKPTGGQVEILLLKKRDDLSWETLVGGKRIQAGMSLTLDGGPDAEIVEALAGSRRIIRFTEPIEPYLEYRGEMPLPPYIHTQLENPDRYQTVYARISGSAAAPTAGLHFTPELMAALSAKGFRFRRSHFTRGAGYLRSSERGGSANPRDPHRMVRSHPKSGHKDQHCQKKRGQDRRSRNDHRTHFGKCSQGCKRK